MTKLSTLVTVTLLSSFMVLAGPAQAQRIEEEPSALAMVGDALIARPVLLGATVAGAAVYTVSLPFSALGGNAEQAGETLVVGPARATFDRCLGCTKIGGNTNEVVNQDDD
ncbi:hypothetical protein ACMDCT_09625 [Halomonadaceae bacterium KBTZ08]